MRNSVLLLSILILTTILHISSLKDDLWWDASVYYGMGKYLYSDGEAGLWENSRPLILPLVFGLFWKIGFPPISIKLASLIFSLGEVCLVYLISFELFKDRMVALSAALATGFFPVFSSFSARALSEIPSTFFLLLGTYLILKNMYRLAGLFFGIAIMTRFFQIFAVFGVIIFILFRYHKKKVNASQMIYFFSLLLLPMFLFLAFNVIQHQDPLLPLKKQIYLTQNTGEIYSEPFSFYVVELLKDNFLLLFIIFGFFPLKKNEVLMIGILIFSVIPYFFIEHKELRLLLPAIPFLTIYLTKGYFGLFKNRLSFMTIFGLIILMNWYIHHESNHYDDQLDYFRQYLKDNSIEEIWISSPQMIVESDTKATALMYYPRYDSEKIHELMQKLPNVGAIFINTCDLLCPKEDPHCPANHQKFLEKIKQEFIMRHTLQASCEYYIFERT